MSPVRSLPVTVNVFVADDPLATKVNWISDVLTVRLGGGGTGELIRLISSTVHLAPSSLEEIYTNAKCTLACLNADRLMLSEMVQILEVCSGNLPFTSVHVARVGSPPV
jgi:hypothetical protein